MTDLSGARGDFPILDQEVKGKPLVYLDNAASTQKPRAVIEAVENYYLRDNSNVHRGLHELSNRATTAFEKARERLARFLNAGSAAEIVWTRGTTEAVNLVAATWGQTNIKSSDVILLTEMEHHSNMVPWQILASQTGAEVRYVPVIGQGERLDLDRLDEYLTDDVKLFAFTHISNTLGVTNPAAELCAKAREKGIVTLVDAAQSAGHAPVDVQAIGCDFLVLSGHKMAGPMGIGALYGRKELLSELPPYQGGGEMISSVTFEQSAWKPAPHRFEAGTPNVAGAIGLAAALDYLEEVGREKIFAHDQELATLAAERVGELNFVNLLGPPAGRHRTGMVTFSMGRIHAHDVVTLANHEGMALRGGHHCNQPLMRKLGTPATSRASFYLYNTPEEIDRLVEVLQGIYKFFNR